MFMLYMYYAINQKIFALFSVVIVCLFVAIYTLCLKKHPQHFWLQV